MKKLVILGTVVTISAFLASCSNKSQTATEPKKVRLQLLVLLVVRKRVALVLLFLKRKRKRRKSLVRMNMVLSRYPNHGFDSMK